MRILSELYVGTAAETKAAVANSLQSALVAMVVKHGHQIRCLKEWLDKDPKLSCLYGKQQ